MQTKEKAFEPIRTAMKLTGGFTLSQLAEISGLEATTIQNWVKRGWIEPPRDRRYGETSIARVLIINMLKGAMQLSNIVSLMSYINGKVDERCDDAIPDGELYSIMCSVTEEIDKIGNLNKETVVSVIDEEIKDYEEPFSGGKEKLRNALEIMMLAHISSNLKNEADRMLQSFIND